MDKVIFPTDNVNIATTTEEPEAKNVSHRNTFDLCQASNPSLTCAFETILLTLLIILVIQEVLQLITLGPKRYLSEFENILEILVLTLAGCGLGFQYNVYILKWVSAWGICLAYLELIFLLGRYPVLGGSISLMFYTITRHLLQTLSSFLILIVGFAFGFFIMYHQSAGDHFENPFKAALKTLVMAVGEIDFEDLYEGHSDDPYALAYTMALMVCLIIMGSLVLINLLIAIIVSDLGELRQSAHIQELVNSAQHIVHFESAISFLCWPLPKKLRPKTIDPVVKICGHSQCKCENRRMSPDIVERLDKIVKRRQLLERVQNVRESKNIVTSVTKLLRSNSMVATSIKRPTTANGLGQVDSATAASDIVQDILELLILNNT